MIPQSFASALLFVHGSALIFLILILIGVVLFLLLRKLFQFALYAGILLLIVLLARAVF